MSEIGTLKELNVKPGDVVEFTETGAKYTTGVNLWGRLVDVADGVGLNPINKKFRIISRAADTLKLWRDMTAAEKGVLLLAHHEGKVIETFLSRTGWVETKSPQWFVGSAYRVKPEPKRITVPLMADFKEIGTIDLVDGVPDQASIKMGEAL